MPDTVVMEEFGVEIIRFCLVVGTGISPITRISEDMTIDRGAEIGGFTQFVLPKEDVLRGWFLAQDVVLPARFGKDERTINNLPGPAAGRRFLGGVHSPDFIDVFV